MALVLVAEEAEWLLIASVGPPLGQSISIFSTITAPFSHSACFIQILPRASWDLRKATQLALGVMMQCQGGYHSYWRSMCEVPVAVLCVWRGFDDWGNCMCVYCVLQLLNLVYIDSTTLSDSYAVWGILVKWFKENCHYLLTLRSFQTCKTFLLPWITNRDN